MKAMKKMLALMLVLAMALGLAACGTSADNKSAQGEQLSVQNVSEEDSTVEVSGDRIGSEDTKKENVSSGDSQNETQLNYGTVVNLNKNENSTGTENGTAENEEKVTQTADKSTVAPNGEYNQGIVLVKVKESFNKNDLGTLAYTSAEPLYTGSKWYSVQLSDATKTEEAVTYLTGLGNFASVDYDYVMGVTGPKEDAEGNPKYDDQVNLGLSNIPHGWTVNGKAPGGSADVVIAVIDTGVDYNHLDLRNNIWINTAEIPDNGRDDDGNGYIDDIYGWDCVGNDKNPMDDNGHGTHVAGIIAAENNKEGGIGVAYNCKVMVLKAGNSSGYFNNSDIAEAIQYAYMNGASVINMSFGGSQISIAVEEALENAYNSCVLVAAAGNDGACNNLSCRTCEKVSVCYPAALPYVIGVMSADKDGKHLSSFSNYDHSPYDSIEYEVYAVGEGVGSTWPSNKYACLNGTSMAAPTVSGIAALLRSYYTDREMYSTKFIQSQIVNTGTVNPHIILGKEHVTDEAHSVADVVEAMTKLPKPAVNLYDYTVDDSTSISNKNNGNGVVDAGETIRLHISLHNRGGVATNVNVSIDTYRSEIGDEAMTDPYFTFVNPTMQLSDIGTYSVRESGDKYFEIVVSPDCPNDYLADFNIRFTYTNGMDEKDTATYSGDGVARFNVSRGYHLPSIISEDTVFKADRLYIVGQDIMIPEGVTVTFEAGCEIQFYDDREYYNSPRIIVYGMLIFDGNDQKTINISPNAKHSQYACAVAVYGEVQASYVTSSNLFIYGCDSSSSINVQNSIMKKQTNFIDYINLYAQGESGIKSANCSVLAGAPHFSSGACKIENTYIEVTAYGEGTLYGADVLQNCFIVYSRSTDVMAVYSPGLCNGNIFLAVPCKVNASANNKLILSEAQNCYFDTQEDNLSTVVPITFSQPSLVSGNAFSKFYQEYAPQFIKNYYDSTGKATVDVYSSLSDASKLWPHVVSIEMFDKDGNPITTIGKEEIKVRVTFNRPMDTTKNTYLTFGTIEPYADYKITGSYISNTVWEGTYTLKAQIENGQNFLKVNNACAAEDQTKVVFGEYQLHEFTIDTTAAMAMNLQAVAKDEGIQLTLVQDDYDTLLGYNIYRSTDKDGNFVKLNPTVLLPEEMDKNLVFKLYVSPLLPLNLDDHNRIPTSYLRLLRRIVRDYETRGASVEKTISMWNSVRNGEKRWIFPFQENADMIFNSSTLYELAVLKKHIYPLLAAVGPEESYYEKVRSIVKVLNYVKATDVDDEIPPTSLVREFIGGNSFYK